MPVVLFQPSGKTVDVPPGTELLDAAKKADVHIDSPCGGKGACGKCIVRITNGEVNSDSLGVLSRTEVADGCVLACKSRVLNTHLTVEVPERIGYEGGKFSDAAEDKKLIRAELFPAKWEYDPLAIKWCVDVPPPQLEDGLSDLDRFVRRLHKEWGEKDFICHLPVLRSLADTLRASGGLVTVTMIQEGDRYHLIHIEPGDQSIQHYGVAVDIGTTSIAVQLVFLPTAEIVATVSDYNDQVSCGLDIISRINYAQRPDRLEDLRLRVLNTINRLINQAAQNHDVALENICNAVLSGNTTMFHLLLGLNPEHIRLEPYTPTFHEAPYLTASELGIEIHPHSWVYLSPSVASYVGGDITAGLLCTDLATDSEEISLFIDIGTNGEIVLGNRDFLMTCACSAGPAFEGGGIEFGMRAALGAIERTMVDPETGVVSYQTIGNVKPKGVCGSGMISLLANLFTTGWIDAAGKLNRERPSDRIRIEGRQTHFVIATAAQTESGKPITISEVDIENIIRAKAAIYSACALMLKQLDLSFEDLSTIYIAGGFGRYLDLEKATILGLTPDLPREKFRYIGNSALTGSYMILMSRQFQHKQLEIARRMTNIELSTDPAYMDQYTGALFLPHTDINLFPTVKEITRRMQSP